MGLMVGNVTFNISNILRWRHGSEKMQQVVKNNNKFQQVYKNIMYHPKDRLDMDIEDMRMLMMKVS
jgi:hypothetical protein